ncbi:hypothetical protein GCM10009745_23030 [Kribbella yunnanensis]|uniref:Uncharacterized protein n=1 Tax=Kribbella yunnanensis TaxID=190194 RepID=A0ABN2GY47_9ACTN
MSELRAGDGALETVVAVQQLEGAGVGLEEEPRDYLAVGDPGGLDESLRTGSFAVGSWYAVAGDVESDGFVDECLLGLACALGRGPQSRCQFRTQFQVHGINGVGLERICATQ